MNKCQRWWCFPPIATINALVLLLLLFAKIVSSTSNAMKLLQVNLINDLQFVDVDLMVHMLINLKFCCRFLPIPITPTQHEKLMIWHHLLMLLIINTINPTKSCNNYNCSYIFHLMLFSITLYDHAPLPFLVFLLFLVSVLLLLIQEPKTSKLQQILIVLHNPTTQNQKIK